MKRPALAPLALALALRPGGGSAADVDREIAKLGQSPVAFLGALELANETAFGLGPRNRTGNLFELRGTVPFTTPWSAAVVARATLPFLWVPVDYASRGGSFGVADISAEALFTPVEQRVVGFGLGPSLRFPTAGDTLLGSHKWIAGPALAVVATPGALVLGFHAANLWSYAGARRWKDLNQLELRPILGVHFGSGWSVVSSPLIVADWGADREDRWRIPLGAGVGKLFGLAGARVALSLEGYVPVVHPKSASRPDFELRAKATFLFLAR